MCPSWTLRRCIEATASFVQRHRATTFTSNRCLHSSGLPPVRQRQCDMPAAARLMSKILDFICENELNVTRDRWWSRIQSQNYYPNDQYNLLYTLKLKVFRGNPTLRTQWQTVCILIRWIKVYNVARMGGRRGAYRALVGRPKRKRRLGRPGTRWEDNIKMDLLEVGLKAWTAMIWRRTGKGGGRLWMRYHRVP